MIAKKGDWVQVHQVVLEPQNRASQLPEDTKQVPLELWIKGYLQQDSNIGDIVEIRTLTGRKVTGKLIKVNPEYVHDFGGFIPELLEIGKRLKDSLYGGDK
jgi:2-amino-4-ketopentanoate thiolase alpha subunit